MANVNKLAGHEIRIKAEQGDEDCQRELKRRRDNNRRGMLVPDWEKDAPKK